MAGKIVVIGSSNVDLIMKMDRLPKVGETVSGSTFRQVFGGKGANQAVAAARAGGEVAFVSCVGIEPYVKQMIQNFKAENIDTRFIFREKTRVTGHALIMIDSVGENYISVAPGANEALSPEHLRKARSVITGASMLVLQYEIPAATIAHLLDWAEQLQIAVLWNFAPARAFDQSYLHQVDILVINEVEAAFLAGLPVCDPESAKAAAQRIRQKGAKMVVITLGSSGVVLKSDHQQLFLPAFQVEAVDTTAAGDVFCGSFAVALTEGQDLRAALRFAAAAAAICVTRIGAQPSVPHREQIEAFLAIN